MTMKQLTVLYNPNSRELVPTLRQAAKTLPTILDGQGSIESRYRMNIDKENN